MRKCSQTSLRFLVIGLVLGVQGIAGVAVTTFFCDQKAELGESFNISCKITGTIVTGMQWIRPDGKQATTCSANNNCFPGLLGYTVPIATNSENVIQITSVGNLDGGNWTCQDGAGGDKGCEIVVQKTPTFTLTIFQEKEIYSVGDTLEVSVDVQDYYCSRPPSFHLLLDSQRVELDALPSDESTTLSGTQNKSITVTEEMTGSINLVFNCRDDIVFANKTFTIMEPTTTTTTSTAMENNTAITTVTTETTTTTPPIQFPLYAIVIIVVAVLAIIIVIIIYFVRKYKNKEAKETYDEASRPQGVMDINLTNKETGANNQEEGSYTSSKFNTSQMTAADDPVQDNPLPGGRSEVRMGGRSEVRMLRM